MNYLVYTSLLNLVLIARLRLLFKDEGAQPKDAVTIGLLPSLLLLFLELNAGWFFLLIWLIVYPFIFLKVEQFPDRRNRNRMLSLALHILVLGILCSPLFTLSLNGLSTGIGRFLQEVLLVRPIDEGEWLSLQVVLLGLLLVINEVNILFRYMLGIFRLEPIGKQGEETDEQEYNTGRLIGILERIFVFIFVLLGHYTAIGFILAAKGVARFQDFKSRTFAEYVLIGTLLSTLFAMTAAYFVKVLI